MKNEEEKKKGVGGRRGFVLISKPVFFSLILLNTNKFFKHEFIFPLSLTHKPQFLFISFLLIISSKKKKKYNVHKKQPCKSHTFTTPHVIGNGWIIINGVRSAGFFEEHTPYGKIPAEVTRQFELFLWFLLVRPCSRKSWVPSPAGSVGKLESSSPWRLLSGFPEPEGGVGQIGCWSRRDRGRGRDLNLSRVGGRRSRLRQSIARREGSSFCSPSSKKWLLSKAERGESRSDRSSLALSLENKFLLSGLFRLSSWSWSWSWSWKPESNDTKSSESSCCRNNSSSLTPPDLLERFGNCCCVADTTSVLKTQEDKNLPNKGSQCITDKLKRLSNKWAKNETGGGFFKIWADSQKPPLFFFEKEWWIHNNERKPQQANKSLAGNSWLEKKLSFTTRPFQLSDNSSGSC